MDLYKTLAEFFEKPEEQRKDKAPEGICPVCWGFQAYDDKIRILFEDKQIDVNNHRSKYMRVQKLLKEKIEGYKLKEAEIHTCQYSENENQEKTDPHSEKSDEI